MTEKRDLIMTEKRTPQIKFLDKNHYLTQASLESLKKFDLGGNKVKLQTDISNNAGLAMVVPLPQKMATELNRKESSIECIVSGIQKRESIFSILKHIENIQAPEESQESDFFFVTLRRRKDIDYTTAYSMKKQLDYAEEQSFIIGIYQDKKKNNKLIFIPEKMKAIFTIKTPYISKIFEEPATSSTSGLTSDDISAANTEVDGFGDSAAQEYAKCFKEFLREIPIGVWFIVALACCTCVNMIGLTIATNGVTLPALIVTCIACMAAIAVVLGVGAFSCLSVLD
ncbi:MAG: hypothetical protein GY710_21190 [Desulfobacteraceae bacterium]|nr:hypothetical protein [Desulfobacteraceae bacterium]